MQLDPSRRLHWMRSLPPRAWTFASWLLIVIVVAAISFPLVESAWWRWDDPQILKQAVSFTPFEYFFVPAAWQTLSAAHLTPWLTASFDLDYWLFGLNPGGFYAHQLLSLLVATLLVFEASRLWTSKLASSVGALLFALSSTALLVANQLMTRHYIEGLAFALISLVLFVRGQRSSRRGLVLLGAVGYFFACASKELFVPLIGLLLFLPEGDFRQRAKALIPYFAVAAFYIPWRIYMLGVAVGGYGAEINLEKILAFPVKALSYTYGPGAGFLLVTAVLLFGFFAAMRRSPIFAFSLLACVMVPLLPVTYLITDRVTDINTPRYLVVVVAVTAFAAAFLVDRIGRTRPGAVIATVVGISLVAFTALARTQAAPAVLAQAQIQEVNGLFYWDYPKEAVFWVDLKGFHHYIAGLRWLKKDERIRVVTDEIELADMDWRTTSIWSYDNACACVKNMKDDIKSRMDDWRSRLRKAPLDVNIRLTDDGVITWRLGPYTDGRYFGINSQVFGTLPLDNDGASRTALRKFPLVVRYNSEEGWITYSDPLQVDLASTTEFNWNRH